MGAHELHETARAIVADHKGILAADESTGTIKKRFDSIGVESTEENRRLYRQLLFTAPGMEDSIGGVILYDETIRQSADDGTPFPELLSSKGVIPGIKVDTGAHDLAGFPGEKVTEGLDGLRGRLEEYRGLGARFAKWRAVITIGDGIPTDACIAANAHALARYAALCQEAGIVPIVEPEVLMDADNTLEVCHEVTTRTLHATFDALVRPAASISRARCSSRTWSSPARAPPTRRRRSGSREATSTASCASFRRRSPGSCSSRAASPRSQATENLNAINQIGGPWPLSFSYGRALQASALQAWGGEPANTDAAQAAFVHRARMNALAVAGEWSAEMEQPVAV